MASGPSLFPGPEKMQPGCGKHPTLTWYSCSNSNPIVESFKGFCVYYIPSCGNKQKRRTFVGTFQFPSGVVAFGLGGECGHLPRFRKSEKLWAYIKRPPRQEAERPLPEGAGYLAPSSLRTAGIISLTSPTRPRSATLKMGAVGSGFMATMQRALRMP